MSKLSDPVRFTHLKQIEKSPFHYKHSVETGFDGKTLGHGRLTHGLILDNSEPFKVYDGKRQGNAWKDWVAEQTASGIKPNNLFTIAERLRAEPVAKRVREHRLTLKYDLLSGEHEREISWQYMNRACSSRLDVLDVKRRRIVDIKTAQTTKPERFSFASRRYSYQAQGAFYAQAAASIGIEIDEVILLTVETAAPYAISVFRLKPRLLEQGRAIVRTWFEELLNCERSSEWPEYADDIVDLDVPSEEDRDFALNWGDDETPATDADEAAQ